MGIKREDHWIVVSPLRFTKDFIFTHWLGTVFVSPFVVHIPLPLRRESLDYDTVIPTSLVRPDPYVLAPMGYEQ